MPPKTLSLLNSAILNVLILQCGGEPTRPPEAPNAATGQLQFPTSPGVDVASGGAAGTTLPPAPPSAVADTETPTPSAEPLRERAPLVDEHIAAIIELINTAEMDQANVARKKSKAPRIKQYAELMLTQHGRAKQEQTKLLLKLQLKPQESARSSEVSAESAGALATLKNATAADFDRLYMDSQVSLHRAALELLDKELIPNTKNVELRSSLQSMRQVVQGHLDEAQKISETLGPKAAPGDASVTPRKN